MEPEPYRNLDISEHGEPAESEVDDLPPGAETFEENDIDDGFSAARLCYLFNFVFLPFSLIPYLRRDNGFSLFHAKQSLAIWIGLMATHLAASLLGFWVWLIGVPVLLVINTVGLNQVQSEQAAPLPLFKKRPQEWFPAVVQGEDE